MAVCVLARNDLSGKPDGGVTKPFGKPNGFEGAGILGMSRATSRGTSFTSKGIPPAVTEIPCAARYGK